MHGIAWNPITSVCYLRLLAAGNFLEFQAIPWTSLHYREFHANLSNLLKFHGLPWNIMECHRHPWKSIDFCGSPWNSMELYGIPWGGWEDPWKSHGLQQWIIHRWQEISNEFYNTPWESIVVHGTPWIDMHGIPQTGGRDRKHLFSCLRLPAAAMEFLEIPWNSMEFHEAEWNFM